jgi:hypothetical protein
MPILSLKNKTALGSLAHPGDVDPGAMIPISTAIVGAGGVSSVSFADIPQTYSHLQLRVLCQFNDSSNGLGPISLRFNSDSGNNYTRHDLIGEGSSASAVGSGTASNTSANMGRFYFTASSSIFGVAVIDILDYTDANKYTTVRALGGTDANGSGEVRLNSSVWTNTAAVTSITIHAPTYNIKQYSHIALYGIKRAGA